MNYLRILLILGIALAAVIYFQSSTKPSIVKKGVYGERISPSPQHAMTQTNASSSAMLTDFIYPNASVVSKSEDAIVVTSDETPYTVTNWYKEKITTLGLHTTTVVQTNANNTIKNVLVGEGSSTKITIEISKRATDKTLQIKITRNNS